MAEPTPPPAPAPDDAAPVASAPLQRRWRALEAFADRRASYRETEKQRRKQKIIFALWCGIVLLLGAFVGLLSWLHPIAGSYLVPLYITEYESRLLPVNSQADPDRAALQNGGYFPYIDENAFASQESHLLVQDLAALKDRRTGPVVVYLCAFACRGEGGQVSILPADATVIQPRSRLPLHEVLQLIYDCPVRDKLLVLDLMKPLASARIGVLEDEAGTLVHEGVQKEIETLRKEGKDPRKLGLILCASSPGQLALTSDNLRRSIFGFYFEEALRGWGAGYNERGIRNNRVTVEDLANFVRARVDRWAVQNRNTRQTPILLGEGHDFALTALEHGQPLPHLEAPELSEYPKWLHEGWKLRDTWAGEWQHRIDPRMISQVEATLLRAEQEWRGGVDADRTRVDLKARLDVLRTRDEHIRSNIPRPSPRSLALAVVAGAKPDPAVLADLKAVVLGITQIPKDLKPEDAAKAKQKLLQDFQTKHKAKSYFDIAYAVFETLADETEPTAEIVLALDGLLLQRQAAPTYIETYFIRQLATLAAGGGEAAWPRGTVRLAFDVVRKGEQAVLAGDVFPWVRGLLDAGSRKRYDAEVILFSRGFAPVDSADRLYHEAREGFDLVMNYEETLRAAIRTREDAFDFLPFYAPFLERNPANATLYKETAAAAAELDRVLAPPPANEPALVDTALFERVKAIGVKTDAVRSRLDDLRWPFGADRVTALVAQSKLSEATPAVAAAIQGVLATPVLRADDRITLWNAGQELARKLHNKTRDLDIDEDDRGTRTARQPEYDLERGRFEADQRTLGLLRAEASIDLLKMGGMPSDTVLTPLTRALRAARNAARQAAQKGVGDDASAKLPPQQHLGDLIRHAWAMQLPEQILETADLNARARLARIVPPLDTVPSLDDLRTNPAVRIRADDARQQWAWLIGFYRYQSRDLEGSAFYADVAVEYQRVVTPGPETYVQLGGPSAVPYLSRFNPTFNSTLRVALFAARNADTPVTLSVVTADDDWLRVSVDPEPLAALRKAAAEFRAAQVRIQIGLKQGAELSRTPRPRGFLVLAQVAGQTFHHRVPVPGLPLPADERVEALLSTDPAAPTAPVTSLRLRPVAGRQPYYLYVRNTTPKPRNVFVQIKVKDALLKDGKSQKVTVPPNAFQQVSFLLPNLTPPAAGAPAAPATPALAAALAAPAAPLPELEGPLHFVVLDADRPTEVLDEKVIEAGIASPREYVQITGAQFSPPSVANGGRNRLEVRLKPLGTLAGPPCRVQLVLPPDRIPGFISAKDGSFSGVLPTDGTELILYANSIRLEEGTPTEGHFYLNVDGLERAYIFRCTFARQGEPITPREDTRPAIRLKADLFSRPVAKYPARLEVDNPPPGSNLELMLTRIAGGAFETDLIQKSPRPRSYHLGFSPQSLDGSLQFDASIQDVTLSLNATGVEGKRELRGYLLDRDGGQIETASLDVTFDASDPDRVRFEKAPKEALKGALLNLTAKGVDDESGIKKVIFFVGPQPADRKIPPTVPQVEGQPNADRSAWTAQLPLTPDRRGPTEVSVQFINGVGLSSFATTTINLLDGEKKPGPGRIVGVVKEGENPQANMEVILSPTDAKTPQEKEKATKTTRTKPDGSYAFEDVAPGKYTVSCTKLISGRAATETVEVAADQLVTAPLSLIVK